ncbi:polyprenyl synthetase family protein [Agromyces kandeliae]|uniref:Polyprenyl synthetase family protein n=1 Tax=Agromyces kandeliae TaxID=2666141 RepID=A0A6L5R040_9MICO|nr:polyprenyl synthetase family protein [Agromyces kandeliae]MRX43382.1 polyprenyl synthetase family protein [Agromyces kandeliae]
MSSTGSVRLGERAGRRAEGVDGAIGGAHEAEHGAAGLAGRVETAVARAPAATATVWAALAASADDQPELLELIDGLAAQRGGKYVRSRLAAAAYLGMGGADAKACDGLSAAVQLLHLGLCVHDDLIDGDDRRHGRPNLFGVTRETLRSIGAASTAEHRAASAAVLAGDLAIGECIGVLARVPVQDGIRVSLVLEVVTALGRAVSGELMDVRGEGLSPEAARPARTAELKTSGYSVALPLRLGALASGRADASALAALEEFGRHLGVAYQFMDDELAVFGDPERTGKSTSSDIRSGKRTFLLQLAYAGSSEQQRASLDRDVGRADLSDAGVERVRTVMRDSGALERHRACIVRRAADAVAALDGAGLPGELEAYLGVLARSVPGRSA